MRPLNDRYSTRTRIGHGGVGEVYEGWQHRLDRPVAIKLLRKELTANPKAVARFEREARTTCLLRHPNVVTVIDVGTAWDGRHFVVMELLEGETLADRLERRGRLPIDEALDIAWQVVRGMGAGEGVGLVHRDLKPENIFVLQSDHVKVLDFGLATLLEGGGSGSNPTPTQLAELAEDPTLGRSGRPARLTRPGALMGTPRYMAPEQVMGQAVDHRSDLYSFGVILFEMLSGRTPFEGPRARDFMLQHKEDPPPPLRVHCADAPEALSRLVDRLLEKDPADRFPNWAALAKALREVSGRRRPGGGRVQPTRESRPTEPYRFLNPFTAASRGIFFGRERDLRLFRETWTHSDQPPLVMLTGASGVGKTSFLSARVVPWLEASGHRVYRVRGTRRPLLQVAHQLARDLGRGDDARDETALSGLIDRLLADDEGHTVVLVLDQLEEVLTAGGAAEAGWLKAGLSAVLSSGDPRVRALLSVREDYLGAMLRALHPLPVDLLARTLPLRPLEAEDIHAALIGPGRLDLPVDYPPFTFEDGLAAEIVADLMGDRAGEVAPRVQLVGAQLWEMVRDDDPPLVIGRHHYQDRLGGAQGILARMLDEAIAGLSPEDQGVAKELLRALTHLPGSATSRPAPESELVHYGGDAERRRAVLRQLEDRFRLVHGYADDRWPGERVCRIAHEALIRRIQDYGEEGSERNRARQVFHQGFSLWLRSGGSEDDLLPEQHYEIVQRHIGDLVLRSAQERRFYEASQERHNDGWIRREEERRRRAFRRQLQLTLVPAALLVAGMVLGQAVSQWLTLPVARARLLDAMAVSSADLSGAQLRGASLRGLRMAEWDLSGADLTQADLTGADLTKANLTGAALGGVTLERANLNQATLVAPHLWDANLRFADLRQARIDADLRGADFRGAIYSRTTTWPDRAAPEGAIGPGGRAPGLTRPGANVDGMDLFDFHAPGAYLPGMHMQRGSLFQASLRGANLQGATLTRVDLQRADLSGADLRGATLTTIEAVQADLSGVDLRGAVFKGEVDLRQAQMAGANLCGADLSQANVQRASWDGVIACERTIWPAGRAPEGIAAPPSGDLQPR